jgi:hypothetical protein
LRATAVPAADSSRLRTRVGVTGAFRGLDVTSNAASRLDGRAGRSPQRKQPVPRSRRHRCRPKATSHCIDRQHDEETQSILFRR